MALSIKLHLDVILIDIHMPELNGIDTTQQIHKYSSRTKIIGVSSHTHHSYVRKLLKMGAMGYVTKSTLADDLLIAMAETMRGKTYLCQEIKDLIAEQAFSNERKSEFILN